VNRHGCIRSCRARLWSRPERYRSRRRRCQQRVAVPKVTVSQRISRSHSIRVMNGTVDRMTLTRPQRCGLADRGLDESGLLGCRGFPTHDRSRVGVDDERDTNKHPRGQLHVGEVRKRVADSARIPRTGDRLDPAAAPRSDRRSWCAQISAGARPASGGVASTVPPWIWRPGCPRAAGAPTSSTTRTATPVCIGRARRVRNSRPAPR
jgi:hypothetical protein